MPAIALVPLRFDAFPKARDRLGERIVQHPDIAGIANEVEPGLVEFDAEFDCGNQASQRLAMFLAGCDRAVDRALEVGMVELAGNAEGDGKIEMADPERVDAFDGGD